MNPDRRTDARLDGETRATLFPISPVLERNAAVARRSKARGARDADVHAPMASGSAPVQWWFGGHCTGSGGALEAARLAVSARL